MKENREPELIKFRRYHVYIEPILKRPETKTYGFLILSVFTCAFFLFFAIRPTINTIINLRKQISDSQEVNKKLKEKISALSQIQVEYEIIKNDLPMLSSALPELPEVDKLVGDTEQLVKENQASLSAIQFAETDLSGAINKEKENKEAYVVSFQVISKGDYDDILNLLDRIARHKRLLTVESLNISRELTGLTSTIRLKAYYLPKDLSL